MNPDPDYSAAYVVLHRAALTAEAAPPSQSSEKRDPLFLTLDDAAAYSGLPTQDLRRLIKDGRLDARKTARHGYRIRREMLEALR